MVARVGARAVIIATGQCDVAHVPAVAGLSDRSDADAMADYLGMAQLAGYEESFLQEISEALDVRVTTDDATIGDGIMPILQNEIPQVEQAVQVIRSWNPQQVTRAKGRPASRNSWAMVRASRGSCHSMLGT